MIAPRDVLRHEWIGRHVLVVRAKNPSLVGVEGLCVDETKQTFRIATARGTKCVPRRTPASDSPSRTGLQWRSTAPRSLERPNAD